MEIDNSVFCFKDYGKIDMKLNQLLEEKNISKTKLAYLTGISYITVNRYYLNKDIGKVDMDIISRICYVLGCRIEDVLEYIP